MYLCRRTQEKKYTLVDICVYVVFRICLRICRMSYSRILSCLHTKPYPTYGCILRRPLGRSDNFIFRCPIEIKDKLRNRYVRSHIYICIMICIIFQMPSSVSVMTWPEYHGGGVLCNYRQMGMISL